MPQYKLKNPKPMGEKDEKFGTTWWSDTHDSPKPVMFNLMSGTVGDGAVIEFEESLNKTSAKGTEYLRLRKVKIENAGEVGAAGVGPPNDNTKLLTLIYEDTQKLLRLVDTKSLSEARTQTQASKQDVVVDVPEGDINLDDIGF